MDLDSKHDLLGFRILEKNDSGVKSEKLKMGPRFPAPYSYTFITIFMFVFFGFAIHAQFK